MNSLVSYEWLSEYVDLSKVTPDEFARRMSLSGPAVEKIIPQGKDLEGIVVGFVTEVKPHPNADKLRLATVDAGEKGMLSIVCGGSNLVQNQWVAVALVGSRVRWHGEGDLITLVPTEIRGVSSEGMICAANEIGLFDAFPHGEREILDFGIALPGMSVKAGTPVADALGLLSDSVMDIEVTSNRVDAMGMVGMAREAAAILGEKFLWKEPKALATKKGKAEKGSLSAKILAKDACTRYMAVRMDGVKLNITPWWMKRRLLSAGIRPINIVVDISNYVMLELAQPIHIFNADAVKGGLQIRYAQANESILALDGKTYALPDSVLVIADAEKPVAIAGVMGGELSGVTSQTSSIIIEAATFDEVVIRRGARKLNIQTDAQLRFEKGLSTAAPVFALARTIELIQELTSAQVVGEAVDLGQTKYKPKSYSITTDEVNRQIGITMTQKSMVDILKRLGFTVKTTGKKIQAAVPWWRDHDIEDGRDFVEEIARVQGYASIPAEIPFGLMPRPIDPELVWERRMREASQMAGMTEVYSYSFVSEDLLTKAGYDPAPMLHVQNPLTADFAVMRTTLLPSLLEIASQNQERFAEQRLFEIANVYYPQSETWNTLPDEQLEIGALFMGMDEAWRAAKGYVETILSALGLHEVAWKRLSGDSFWHPGRSVQAFYKGDLVATVGEVSPAILKNFKLERVAMVDMPLEKILPHARSAKTYQPDSVFPEAKRDLAIVIDRHVEYDDIARAIRRVDPLITGVEWFDTYEGPHVASGKKSLGMHLVFSHPDRTLASAEVDALMERLTLELKEHFKAELRG